MEKRKGLLNISVSILSKVIAIIFSLVVRRLLIQHCGNEANGLHALYSSIISFLSVAELGVGAAITFCMYKPVAEGDEQRVAALYHLFRRIYWCVGGIVFALGIFLIPILPHLARDYTFSDRELSISFFLMLVSIVCTYLYGAQISLINAHQNNYVTTLVNASAMAVQSILQIIVLITTHSFYGYLVCVIAAALVHWLLLAGVTQRKYPQILSIRPQVDAQTKAEVIKNARAMFLHRIGTLLVYSTDSILISVFAGLSILGMYSNYMTVLSGMTGLLGLIFSSLNSVLGHLYVKRDRDTTRRYSDFFHLLNFAIGAIFHLGYYAVIDNLIAILFSSELVMDRSISFVVTLNSFVQFMRRSTLTFRDATGAFYNDRWKALLEGIINIILSVAFVHLLGITGVITATVITNLILCHIVEPYVLYKHSFQVSPKSYYIKNYGMILLFTVVLFFFDRLMVPGFSQWQALLVNGSISVCISVALCAVVFWTQKDSILFLWKK